MRFVRVPKYDEFKTGEAWKQIRNKGDYSPYFKDYSEKSFPTRTYMYNVKIHLL